MGHRPLHRILSGVFIAIAPIVLHANTLSADGILRVRGGSWSNARVTILPEFGEAFDLPLNDDRFQLDLGLRSTYLVRASHPGCATKEVVFDLRLPGTASAESFRFPFEIILEHFAKGEEPFEYAQPVGLVFYDEEEQDFIYTTDYTRMRKVLGLDSMIKRMAAHIERVPVQVDALADLEWMFVNDPNASLPSVEKEDPSPLADQTVAAEEKEPGSPVIVDAPYRKQGDGSANKEALHASVPVEAGTVSGPPLLASAAPTSLIPPAAKPPASRFSAHWRVTEPGEPSASHELQTMRTMVIAIDRFSDGTSATELRKVTHAFGAVFYFEDGISIDQREYEERLGALALPGHN
ncbi:MAG TPA: hypothetical protein PKN30_02345 [Flavobacteriales bacterium]|nr:hypothetical protein [Flavobacteriales bacterium]